MHTFGFDNTKSPTNRNRDTLFWGFGAIRTSKTNNSVTATQVTFDADIDDRSSSGPDDETTTMFQSAVTVDNESEDDSNTDNEEEREYSIEIIEGVRYLKYHVVVPPDTPTETPMRPKKATETPM